MSNSKLNPCNWFKKESEHERTLPIKQTGLGVSGYASPIDRFHADFDRMVDSMFSDFGMPSPRQFFDKVEPGFGKTSIKPKVDVYGTDNEYVIEAELPGIEEKDLSIDLKDDVLVLSAEMKHEEKTEEKGYYRVERSYGSFKRILNVPEDADKENITAKLNKGILRVTMPRTKLVESNSRKIAIESSTSQ